MPGLSPLRLGSLEREAAQRPVVGTAARSNPGDELGRRDHGMKRPTGAAGFSVMGHPSLLRGTPRQSRRWQ